MLFGVGHTTGQRRGVARQVRSSGTAEQQAASVRERFMAWQEERGFTFWAVERREDGALLGFCGLKIADDAGSPVHGNVEIGWRFLRAARR